MLTSIGKRLLEHNLSIFHSVAAAKRKIDKRGGKKRRWERSTTVTSQSQETVAGVTRLYLLYQSLPSEDGESQRAGNPSVLTCTGKQNYAMNIEVMKQVSGTRRSG